MKETLDDYDVVVLLVDRPDEGLPAGQIGTILMIHDQGEAFEVEFILGPHQSVVATVWRDQLLKLKGMGYPAQAI